MAAKGYAAVTEAELMQLSAQNSEMRFERNADGSLEVMSPTGGISGNRELRAGAYLLLHVENQGLGEVFGAIAGFRLANGAVRAPDVAFVAKDRLPEGWDEGDDSFLPLAPDFVIEIRSKSDALEKLQAKMQEYRENGVRLGWLVDRQNQQVWVYRADGSVTQYPATVTLSGEDVVPGFEMAASRLL